MLAFEGLPLRPTQPTGHVHISWGRAVQSVNSKLESAETKLPASRRRPEAASVDALKAQSTTSNYK